VADSVVQGIKRWTDELFDFGVAVTFTNTLATEEYVQEHSGWEHPPANTSGANVMLHANYSPMLPKNVVIEWGDSTEILDTVYSQYNSVNPRFRRPVNFRLFELGSNERVPCVIEESLATTNGRIDKGELIILVVPKPNSYVLTPAWRISFPGPADSTIPFIGPLEGERYVVRPAIPFGREDSYEFNTTESIVRTGETAAILDRISVVPNPYIEAAIWEQQPYLKGRGERKIFFINLPARCVVRIYSVNGYLLREITHDGMQDASGSVFWDLTTSDGLEVASGLYIYHVDAEGIGTKVGKFAIVN